MELMGSPNTVLIKRLLLGLIVHLGFGHFFAWEFLNRGTAPQAACSTSRRLSTGTVASTWANLCELNFTASTAPRAAANRQANTLRPGRVAAEAEPLRSPHSPTSPREWLRQGQGDNFWQPLPLPLARLPSDGGVCACLGATRLLTRPVPTEAKIPTLRSAILTSRASLKAF